MRYIPLLESGGPQKNGQPDLAWLAKANALTAQLTAAPDQATRQIILDAKANEIWGEIKDWLLSLSNNKCWFSEAEDVFSHRDVEHFRPKRACKRKVGQKKLTYEEGYWWLTYEWENYRICGNVGNVKKGIFFPLQTGSLVSTYGGVSHRNECQILLDPISPTDPLLLDFIEAGKAVPHNDATTLERERVEVTVKHLRLDFDKLEEARAKVWSRCRFLIEECRKLTNQMGPAEKAIIEANQKELRRMVSPEAQFSMTASACLRKSGIGWAGIIAGGG